MKEKTRNLIELIIQGAILILIFVPGMYQKKYWKADSTFPYGWTHKWTVLVSHWSKGMYLSDITAVLLWALIIIICVVLVLYIIQYIGAKEKLNSKISRLLPIIELAIFIVSAFFTQTDDGGGHGIYKSYYSYSLYVVFPIMIALMIALILLPMIQTKVSKPDFVEDSVEEHTTNLTADELRKYKALYDDGIITYEEYEKKKNQILNNK